MKCCAPVSAEYSCSWFSDNLNSICGMQNSSRSNNYEN